MNATKELLPATEWVKRANPEDPAAIHDFLLTETDGRPYNATAHPWWMDTSGLEYLRQKADNVHLTLIFGQQLTDYDLQGVEDLTATRGITLACDASVKGFGGADRSYVEKWNQLFPPDEVARFNPLQARNPADADMVDTIQQHAWTVDKDAHLFTPHRTDIDEAELFESAAIRAAAAAHHARAQSWQILNNVGNACAQMDSHGGRHRAYLHNVVVSLSPFDRTVEDAARLILRQEVGEPSRVDRVNVHKEIWANPTITQTNILHNIIVSGRIDARRLLR